VNAPLKIEPKQDFTKKYFLDESDTDSDQGDNSFEEIIAQCDKSLVPKEAPNTMQLFDLDLVNLLRLCSHLKSKYKEDNEDYQDEIMLNSF
jgi:hypothetical protein